MRPVALLCLLLPLSAQAHRNYSNPELAWTCKLGEKALLCGMSAPLGAIERVLMRQLRFENAPTPDVQRALRTELETLFRLKNAVEIDDQRAMPKARSMTLLLDLPHADMEDPAVQVPGVKLHQSRWDIVRFVVSYPIAQRPKKIALTWDTAAALVRITKEGRLARIPELPGSLMIDGRWVEVRFTPESPTFVWRDGETPQMYSGPVPPPKTSVLALPLWSFGVALVGVIVLVVRRRQAAATLGLTVVVAGALIPVSVEVSRAQEPLAPAEARQVFEGLLSNIYRAFDHDEEAAIYDTLAASVDGPLLETVYTDVYESLVLREDGGAVCKVDGVEVKSAELVEQSDGRFQIEARWRVTGTVSHEQHRHRRTNAYHARYTVGATEAGWRLVEVEVLDLRRMALATQDVPLDDKP